MGGLFITFEGIEGSGKSTQAKMLFDHLKAKHPECLLTREPGGTKISEKIREIILDEANVEMAPRTELFLYCASRSQHVEEVIRPALNSSKVVISDRYADATVAYQGAGRDLAPATVTELNRVATQSVVPDVTFLLDLPVKVGLSRIHREDRIEKEEEQFHDRVRNGYLEMAAREPGRIVVLDGEKNQNEIHSEVVGALAPLLREIG
jgi:dTMP kinase